MLKRFKAVTDINSGAHPPGSEFDMDAEEGAGLVASGAAMLLAPESKKAKAPDEDGDKPAPPKKGSK